MQKICNLCNTLKSKDEFYKAGEYYQSKCKPCFNAHTIALSKARYLVKPRPTHKKEYRNPFQKLPQETREGILKLYGVIPLTKIALKFNIKIQVLRRWKKANIISI